VVRRVVYLVRGLGAALLACLATTVLVPSAADAAPYPPTAPCALSVDRNELADGLLLTVAGSGLGPDLAVNLELRPNVALGTARTDDAGGFVTVVQVPSTLTPGRYVLVASTASGSCQLPTETAPTPATEAPPSGTPTGTSEPPDQSPGPAATSTPAPATSSAFSPVRASAPDDGPLVLTLALIAMLVLGGSALMLGLTGRRRA
jgi:hypothetical protein